MAGAKEGLKFYLVPDFGRMQEVGVVSTLVGAMNQAFFTLSLGIGAMAIFGSYIGRKDHCLGNLQILRFWIHLWQSYPV